MVTLALRSCVARQEPYIPGALSILQGTVPGRVRGSGHMVPTYFRRELRDRVLQRPSRLRTFLVFVLSLIVCAVEIFFELYHHRRRSSQPRRRVLAVLIVIMMRAENARKRVLMLDVAHIHVFSV